MKNSKFRYVYNLNNNNKKYNVICKLFARMVEAWASTRSLLQDNPPS